jgi:hypothetical protein
VKVILQIASGGGFNEQNYTPPTMEARAYDSLAMSCLRLAHTILSDAPTFFLEGEMKSVVGRIEEIRKTQN